MTPQANHPRQSQSEEIFNEELDIFALIIKVLSTWRILMLALIIVTLLLGAIKAIKIVFLPGEIAYAKPIRLTFKGADKLEFPSGAKFAYSDIIAPAVALAVHERNHLGNYGVTVEDLQGSLSAEPYAPTYPMIIERYEKKLADKRLTVEQISELEAGMKSDIKQAIFGTVLISMHLEKVRLPEEVASKVLSDIPAIWAEKTIHDKGVLDINIPIATSKTLNPDLIEHVEYMIVSDLLDEKLALLRKNIKFLSEYQGVATVKDPISGMSLFDLSTAINDLGKYVIDEVLSPIRYLGLSKDSKLSIFYYEDKLKKSEMDLELLQNQSDLAKQAYDSYIQSQNQTSSDAAQKNTSALVAPQLNNDLLDRLMGMSGDVDREKYRQKLNQQWLKYTLDAADIKRKILDIKQVLASLKKADANTTSTKSTIDQTYLDHVQNALPDILKNISSYFDITERIYEQLSVESIGVRDQLYIPITSSVLVKKEGLEVKQTLIIWFALMLLTMVIVPPVVLIYRALTGNARS